MHRMAMHCVDVAMAEHLAGPGELVVSPSVYKSLKGRGITSITSKFVFTSVEDGFQRVHWPNHPTKKAMLSFFQDKHNTTESKGTAQSYVDKLVHLAKLNSDDNVLDGSIHSDNSSDIARLRPELLQSDIMQLLECHRHEASRGFAGKFTGELRRVAVIFISILYEPTLPDDPSEDNAILENFQNIYSVISESVSSRSGQVRQFINDDKGTVFIASFGLRGSVTFHPSSDAVDAAKDAQHKLLDLMDIQCSIGITLGKIFCGETGSTQRYEYSMLGPPCNLSARLMAKGAPGQINCDKEVESHPGSRHSFTMRGTHQLKGYEDPVPFFAPIEEPTKNYFEEKDDIVTFYMQKQEVLDIVQNIHHKRKLSRKDNPLPGALLVKGNEGEGRNAFISAILNQRCIRSSSIVLEANQCYHDDPFYCFIPIITKILLSFDETRDRLLRIKRKYKRSSVLASFLGNDAFKTPSFPRGTKLVPESLEPYRELHCAILILICCRIIILVLCTFNIHGLNICFTFYYHTNIAIPRNALF